MLRRTLDCFARLDVDAAAEVIRDDAGIDTEFRLDPAPAHHLHDGRSAHHFDRARDRVDRQGDRAHRRPREEHGRVRDLHRQGHRRAAHRRWRRERHGPRGRGRAADPGAPRREPGAFGHKVLRAASAEEAEAASARCPTCSCSTGCCPASRASPSRGACAPNERTRELPILMLTARAMEQDKISAWRRAPTITSPSRSRRRSSLRASRRCLAPGAPQLLRRRRRGGRAAPRSGDPARDRARQAWTFRRRSFACCTS